jgi:hypothetical protein
MKKLPAQIVRGKTNARFILTLILFVFAVSARAGNDEAHCRAFYGPFSSVIVPPPDCQSPVGLCTHGTLVGELSATYDFTALTERTDPNDPNVMLLTGMSIVTTANGVIHTDDVSTINFATGDFVTKALVHDSDIGQAQTGGFIAAGVLDLTTGEASGTYSAILCAAGGK